MKTGKRKRLEGAGWRVGTVEEFLRLSKQEAALVEVKLRLARRLRALRTRRRLSQAAGEERLVLATGRYVGEGFDDARLDTLFLAMPIAWRGTLVQYAGRLHRRHPGKTEVRIYDYVDREVPVLARMFEKRLRGYRALGYQVAEATGPAQGRDPRHGWDDDMVSRIDVE